MLCGACGSASENETFCPGCGADLSVMAERREAASPSQDSLPVVDEGAPRCPQHPTMGSGATCRRCGRFVCSRCTEDALRAERITCPQCADLEAKEARPERVRSYRAQLITSWLLVAGVLAVAVVGLAFFLDQDRATRLGVVVLLAPALALLLLATVLFAATRRAFFGWTATVMESLMLVPLWVTSPSWCTAVLAAAPIFSAVRLLQLKELASSASPPT
ncbi:MAG: hypothetical protein JNJ54_32545 [Myxococcaceae bacterium]|nr:hypothetical protein [Myxococcaceae bacterium]